MKSHVLDAHEREQRHKEYLAAPLISDQFPRIDELAVRMQFNDPEGREKPQPYSQLFAPEMRAFFQFQCPLRECNGGGFDLTTAIPRGLARKGAVTTGSLSCGGQRRRSSGGTQRCGLHLNYEINSRVGADAAA